MIEKKELAECIHTACSSIANGSLPGSVPELFSSSQLIALPKSNGDVRPIAIGESLRRITAKTICRQKRSCFSNFFQPAQHGVATECGLELLHHHIQLLLADNPHMIVLKTDVKNAFNLIHRSHLLEQVSSCHPDIYLHVCQMYSHSSSLVYQQGNSIVIIPSEEGIHQGDPLGPALFSTGIHSVLSELQDLFPSVKVLAYLDDVFLVGLEDDVLSSLENLKLAFSSIGLQISTNKCEIYSPSGSLRSDFDDISVSSDGIIILGAPIGSMEYVSTVCCQYAESGKRLCDQLQELGEVQSTTFEVLSCSSFEPSSTFHFP